MDVSWLTSTTNIVADRVRASNIVTNLTNIDSGSWDWTEDLELLELVMLFASDVDLRLLGLAKEPKVMETKAAKRIMKSLNPFMVKIFSYLCVGKLYFELYEEEWELQGSLRRVRNVEICGWKKKKRRAHRKTCYYLCNFETGACDSKTLPVCWLCKHKEATLIGASARAKGRKRGSEGKGCGDLDNLRKSASECGGNSVSKPLTASSLRCSGKSYSRAGNFDI